MAFSEGTDATGLEQTENKKNFFGLFWNFPLPSIAPRPSHKPRPGVRRQTGTLAADAKQHLAVVPRPELLRHAPQGRGRFLFMLLRVS